MNISKLIYRLSFGLFVLKALGLFIPQAAFCQVDKLGIVRYEGQATRAGLNNKVIMPGLGHGH